MPAKNSVKTYIEGGYYHLYNRGVEKRTIFSDNDDYYYFLNLLKIYLSEQPKTRLDLEKGWYIKKNLHGQIEVLAYCLMPNHFHLLVRQFDIQGITKLMQCLATSYVGYFNRKYQRVGALFQGKFKAALVESDLYLLHLSRYIHLNPVPIGHSFSNYKFSSYSNYLGNNKISWLNREEILGYFKTSKRTLGKDYFSYQAFVEDYHQNSAEFLQDLVLEELS